MNILAGFFEVMDKEPTVVGNYVFFISLGLVALFLCRYRVWLAVVALPILLITLWIEWGELHRPSVAAAILREAGHGYFIHCYVAMGIAGFLSAVGVLIGLAKHKAGARFVRRAT